MMPEDPNIPNYWQALMFKPMKHTPLVPAVNPLGEDKIVDRVAHRGPKTYDEKYDPLELEV